MRMKLLMFCAILLAGTFAFPQASLRSGFVITNSGDTLKGLVAYSNWSGNPGQITYSSADGRTQNIPISDLKSLRIDGEGYFVKAILSISARPLDTLVLKTYTDTNAKTDTFLLKQLVSGGYNLYSLHDFKDHFFLQSGAGPIQELVYEMDHDEYYTRFFESNVFRKQLSKLIAGTKSESPIGDRIANLLYNEQELTAFISIADSINSGMAVGSKYEKKVKLSYFAGLGLAYNHITASGAGDASISSVDYIGKLRPGVQVGIDFSGTRNFRNMVFRIEMGYYKYLQMGVGTVQASPGERPRNTRYQVLLISMKPGFNALYKVYNTPGLGVYVGAGYVISFNVKSRNRMRNEYLDDGSAALWEPYRKIHSFWGQGVARAGILLGKKFEVGLNFPFAGSFLHVDGLKLNPGNNSLVVNYRF
jgi:hypothetical protein